MSLALINNINDLIFLLRFPHFTYTRVIQRLRGLSVAIYHVHICCCSRNSNKHLFIYLNFRIHNLNKNNINSDYFIILRGKTYIEWHIGRSSQSVNQATIKFAWCIKSTHETLFTFFISLRRPCIINMFTNNKTQ